MLTTLSSAQPARGKLLSANIILIVFILVTSINCDILGTVNTDDEVLNSPENFVAFIQNDAMTVSRSANITSSSVDRTKNRDKILSRQKRYLIFPEGSSLQVVFDQIIPIVDYTNYLILGITVALAWELPSKRPSELFEDVKEKLNDGTLGLRQDEKIDDLQYIKEPELERRKYVDSNPYNPQRRVFSTWNDNSFYGKQNYYKTQSRPFYSESGPVYYNASKWAKYGERRYSDYQKYPRPNTNWNKGSWWNVADRISSKLKRRRPVDPGSGGGYQGNVARKHRIYPVFGKRSTDSHHLTEEEKFHLRYHRTTRQQLYIKIEKYLNTQGKNGLHCVLKTLCETGQRRHEEEPDTFVREILRAIFTMPKSIEPVTNRKHRMYDEAHHHRGSCDEEYQSCPGSIWEDDFLF